MTINLLTHGDLDGAGCAVVIKRMMEEEPLNIEFCDYENIDSKIKEVLENDFQEFDLLLITDICPSKETCKELNKFTNRVMLADHHRTRKWVKKYDWAVFQEGKCGTFLVYDQIIPRMFDGHLSKYKDLSKDKRAVGLEEFVKAIDAWDCWHMDSEHRKRGENLNALTFFIGLENFVKEFSIDLKSDESIVFSPIIGYINENKDRHVKNIIENQLHETPYRMDDYGQTYKILFCDNYISEVAHAALDEDDSQDLWYIVIVSPTKNVVSLRTKRPDKINVNILAEKFGGGGHSTAAGFRMDLKKKLEGIISNKFNLMDNK